MTNLLYASDYELIIVNVKKTLFLSFITNEFILMHSDEPELVLLSCETFKLTAQCNSENKTFYTLNVNICRQVFDACIYIKPNTLRFSLALANFAGQNLLFDLL